MELLSALRGLRSLAAVAQTGSSQQAAGLLHVAQSSVTRAVQQLETLLGAPLFERGARGMLATPRGRQLALRATRAFQFLADADAHRPRSAVQSWHGSPLVLGAGERHLQVLQALALAGSQARAAQRLGMSQPAVHQTLLQLEHMAGATLFVRVRSGLRLDEAGERVLQGVRLALAELRQAADEWQTEGAALRGRLVVGTLPFSTTMLLSPAVERVLAQHPGVRITIIDGTFDALLAQLRRAEVDCIVGALRSPVPGADVQQALLFEDQLGVVVRGGHPLAARRRLRWEQLHAAQWVMPMPDTPAESAFQHMARAAGLPPPVDPVRTNSALMMQALLANSDRLALMSPRQVAGELAAGLLVQLPLTVQHARRRIGVMQRAEYLPTPAANAFFQALHAVGSGLREGSDQ